MLGHMLLGMITYAFSIIKQLIRNDNLDYGVSLTQIGAVMAVFRITVVWRMLLHVDLE